MRWLRTTFLLGDPLLPWAKALGIAALVFLLLLALRALVIHRLGRIAERTPTGLDDIAVAVARRTRVSLILILSLWLGSLDLQLVPTARRVLQGAALVAVFLQIALWASLAVNLWVARAQRRRADDASAAALANVLRFVATLVLWSILLLLLLDNLGVDVTALVAGLGIGGIAVALALQNVLGDLLASLSIVFDKPFVIGDTISVDDLTGTVESIGMKTTRLRSAGGEQLVLANGELLKSRIRNWARLSERRVLLTFGLSYQTPMEAVARIPDLVRKIVESQDLVRFDRAHFKGFGSTSLDFEAVYWILTPDYKAFMDRQQAVNLGLLQALEREGIGLAQPAQTPLPEKSARPPALPHPPG